MIPRADRDFLVSLAIAGALVTACNGAARSAETQRPNVVVLISDDHHHGALGCAGNTVVRTPQLDRLAAGGVHFTHCFTPNPICTPSRACILTGQDSWTNGVTFFGKPIAAASPQWPKLLSSAGYETFFTGKWHNEGVPAEHGFTSGANIFVGGMSNHAQVPLVNFGERPGPKTTRTGTGFSSELFADAAVNFLNSEHHGPFCLYAAFTAPHDPRMPPAEFAAMYSAETVPLPPNFMPQPPLELYISGIRDEKLLPFPRTEADVRRETALYYGMLTHLDRQIGRILDALDEQHLAQDTLVIFVGDHGLSLGAHGVVGKQTLYEEGVRTPLIVRYPRLNRGPSECHDLTSLIDIFPTICEAAGVAIPANVEGRSLLTAYRGDASAARSELFATYHDLQRSVRTTQFKLIAHLRSHAIELFDLTHDPFEMKNLAGDSAHADVQKRLEARLAAWRAGTPGK